MNLGLHKEQFVFVTIISLNNKLGLNGAVVEVLPGLERVLNGSSALNTIEHGILPSLLSFMRKG